MTTGFISIEEQTSTGNLGVYHLKRFWSSVSAARLGNIINNKKEAHLNYLLVNALGLGWEQTYQYLFEKNPSFDEFENWIIETTGGVATRQIDRINAAILGTGYSEEINNWIKSIVVMDPVLSNDDLQFWDKNGYVILHDAISNEGREAALQAIFNFIDANPDDPDSWYKPNDHGIMLQYFQHPAFDANRSSTRIHKAFAQLWGTADLWVSTDRCGFNVPERIGFNFRGPDLHWDTSIFTPIPFGTQGILYLTDTEAEQGAFTCVPGFHHRIEEWLKNLPPGANPRNQNLHALGSQPIAGKAGDLIIWHHALPHGSRPNRSNKPRIVQYINMYPTYIQEHDIWI